MTDHAGNFRVAQFLCGSGALFRVGCIVFGNDFKFNLFAGDHNILGVEVLDGHAGAVFIVFAVVGLSAGYRRHVADFDDLCFLSSCHARYDDQGG